MRGNARPSANAAAKPSRRRGSDPVSLDGLADHAGYLVRRFQVWIFQDFIRTLAAVDIRPAQYSVLTIIGANPGLTQMAVAQRIGVERARLVHLLDGLERRRLVKRLPSPTDRRSHALHLTPAGCGLLGRCRDLAAEHERHVADRIGAANRVQLLRILSAFRESGGPAADFLPKY